MNTTKATVKGLIKNYSDFPEKGIIFRDISPIISSASALRFAIDDMYRQTKNLKFNKILAIDARGFIFASALAYKSEKGMIMCRKPSKLPGELITEDFGYEYASTSLSIQKSSIKKSDIVLIVDDVLATGNTALSAYNAVLKTGGKVAGIIFLLELGYLGGRDLLTDKVKGGTKILNVVKLEK